MLRNALAAACAKYLGATDVAELCALTGGAASATYAFDATVAGKTVPLILQRAAGPTEPFVAGIDKRLQARLQGAAYDAGLPVAGIRFIAEDADGLGPAFVMDRIAGETVAPKILRAQGLAAARAAMTRQAGEIAARIHRFDAGGLGLPTVSAKAQLAGLRDIYLRLSGALPVFELGFRWLDDHCPADRPVRLVHGDFRLGNFVVGPNGIVAVLDWELAHLGDPMEDLGWLMVRSWRFGAIDRPVGGFGGREDLYAAYQAESGQAVDPRVVRFWQTLGTLKWGVICLYMAHQHLSGAIKSLERAAVGRRVSETELDLLLLLSGEGD